MANSKRTKIIKELRTLTERTVTPDEVQKNIGDLVQVAKDELDMDDDAEAKDFVSGFVGEGDDATGRGIEAGMNPESGEDEYEDYRKLKDMLTKGGYDGEETQIEEDNDPIKLKNDVKKVMDKLDMGMIAPFLDKIDNPVEQAEMIAQFAEKIGVPKTRLAAVVGQLKKLATNDTKRERELAPMEAKMSKGKLIETVKGKKQKRVIKTVKVKDIK